MALRADDLTIFDFCAGTGMLSCAIELACAAVGVRARTIGYCERDSAAAACIVARMESKTLHPAPIWDDARTLDCQPWCGAVDILCAGYPCQPFSTAGKRLGHRDLRHLWPAVRRAIARTEPGIVFMENVEGHVGKGAGKVLRDLTRLGYYVTAGLFTSAECGASHQRKRLFILGVAHTDQCGGAGQPVPEGRRPQRRNRAAHDQRGGGNMGHFDQHVQQPWTVEEIPKRRKAPRTRRDALPRYAPACNDFAAWARVAEMDPSRMPAIESALRGVADGLAPWADQLRLCGNGVDPLAAAYAFLSLLACIRE